MQAGEQCGSEMWEVVGEMSHNQGDQEDEGLAHRGPGQAIWGCWRVGFL